MKKSAIVALLVLAALCILAVKSMASPYFRFAGQGNWNLSEGVSFSHRDLAKTQNVTMLALITHSEADGSILPQAWVDAGWANAWTPLSVGFGCGQSTSGKLGSSANMSPAMRTLAIKVLEKMHKPTADGLAGLFKAMPENLTFAFGPELNAEVIQDGRFMPMNQWWNDPLRWDFLASWKFGKVEKGK